MERRRVKQEIKKNENINQKPSNEKQSINFDELKSLLNGEYGKNKTLEENKMDMMKKFSQMFSNINNMNPLEIRKMKKMLDEMRGKNSTESEQIKKVEKPKVKVETNDKNSITLVFDDNENKKVRITGDRYGLGSTSFYEENEGKISVVLDGYEITPGYKGFYDFDTTGKHVVKIFLKTNKIDIKHMFAGCDKLISVEGLENLDTSEEINIRSIFAGCTNLKTISGLSKWDVSNASCFACMFYGCDNLDKKCIPSWYPKSKLPFNLK